jgi:hypothetical protein
MYPRILLEEKRKENYAGQSNTTHHISRGVGYSIFPKGTTQRQQFGILSFRQFSPSSLEICNHNMKSFHVLTKKCTHVQHTHTYTHSPTFATKRFSVQLRRALRPRGRDAHHARSAASLSNGEGEGEDSPASSAYTSRLGGSCMRIVLSSEYRLMQTRMRVCNAERLASIVLIQV